MNRRASKGLYVHIPFCSVKCFYCDFTAFSGKEAEVDRYLDALAREADLYPSSPAPSTLYVGGGTPSELAAGQIARLLSDLSSRFGPAAETAEATFELNPESADAEKLDVLRDGGVGRLSVGLQTADDGMLRAVGRRHGWLEFERLFLAARERDFDVSVDLMCALPGQTTAAFRDGLRRVLGLGPDHVSLYPLSVEDRTLFKKREVSPDEDLAREMLETAYADMDAAGFERYEISNFARPGKRSAHNGNYWLDGEYLGLGCGAAGHLDGARYQNEESFGRYLAAVEAGRRPAASEERLTGKEKEGERLMLGLRRSEGIRLSPGAQELFRSELESLLARGLVVLDGGCSRSLPSLRLSPEGRFLSNEVFREFVPPYADAGRRETA